MQKKTKKDDWNYTIMPYNQVIKNKIKIKKNVHINCFQCKDHFT